MRSIRFKKKKETEIEQEEVLRIVTFTVGEEMFGADILRIKEIDLYEQCTRIPDLPEFIEGVIMVRKEVVPLIDLRKRFFGQEAKSDLQTRIIVAMVGNTMVGFVVDAVSQVMTVAKKLVTLPPRMLTKVDEDYIQGIVALEKQRILLVDFDKILSKNRKRELLSLLSEEEKKELARLALEENKKASAESSQPSQK
jgi:purine-binding chemotaxis protein CheW